MIMVSNATIEYLGALAEAMKERGSFDRPVDDGYEIMWNTRLAVYKMKQRGFTREEMLEVILNPALRIQVGLVYHPEFDPERDLKEPNVA